jgi:hypothetical protein
MAGLRASGHGILGIARQRRKINSARPNGCKRKGE